MVSQLSSKIEKDNLAFFRLFTAFAFSSVASSMRVTFSTIGREPMPVNVYCLNLARSGEGKGFAKSLLFNVYLKGFRKAYMDKIAPAIAENHMVKAASNRSAYSGLPEKEEFITLESEYKACGESVFVFSDTTEAAIKQYRTKLVIGNTGAINYVVDEIGSSLSQHMDIMKVFLELYDKGEIEDKLLKNTDKQVRAKQVFGMVPTNLMLFGTPSKLFDGGKNEDLLYSFINTGLARRAFYNVSNKNSTYKEVDAEVIYKRRKNVSEDISTKKIKRHFTMLAKKRKHGTHYNITKKPTLLLIKYSEYCKKIASTLPNHKEDEKACLNHAENRVAKLASIYAFIDNSRTVKTIHIKNAIKMDYDSTQVFINNIMKRDKPYIRLAKYLAHIDKAVTVTDLDKELPYFPTSKQQRQEMLHNATIWGYNNQIAISTYVKDGVEFIRGKALEKTDLNKLIIALNDGSSKSANFENHYMSFKNLARFTMNPAFNFINHHTKNGKRRDDALIKGFNFVVLDVDNITNMETVKALFSDYHYILYTTKRFKKKKHRFRLILPISHKLYLNKKQYSNFMKNLYDWLPFEVDKAAKDRPRKWLTNKGKLTYNKGDRLFNITELLNTDSKKKNREYVQYTTDNARLENWFLRKMHPGNRNNMLARYAFLLADQKLKYRDIVEKVYALNNRLQSKLPKTRIDSTILVSLKERMR